MRIHSEEEADALAQCRGCGYNTRGLAVDECPECGATYLLRLASFDLSGEYHAAAAALADDGIGIESVILPANTATFNQLFAVGDGQQLGMASIFVKRSEFRRASAILKVQVEEPKLPIVDRAEPICPKCSAALDQAGPEVCLQCGASFLWVEINQPPLDTTGMHCRECDYDLTGIKGECCPECGHPVIREISAIEKDETARVPRDEGVMHPSSVAIIALAAGLLVMAVVLALASEHVYIGAGMVGLAGLMIVVDLFRAVAQQRRRRAKQSGRPTAGKPAR
ncbi:MAG: hypothetical protein L0219_05275 [Phycisphaerales bacterium]|nr:hypothetical protein [Phycisphaerales bacterium]MCI0675030.1 hypothetical protein [Phycisphaerales bacterium]